MTGKVHKSREADKINFRFPDIVLLQAGKHHPVLFLLQGIFLQQSLNALFPSNGK